MICKTSEIRKSFFIGFYIDVSLYALYNDIDSYLYRGEMYVRKRRLCINV